MLSVGHSATAEGAIVTMMSSAWGMRGTSWCPRGKIGLKWHQQKPRIGDRDPRRGSSLRERTSSWGPPLKPLARYQVQSMLSKDGSVQGSPEERRAKGGVG